jgi:glycosyltransferase involved in cell wall biosynthesis
MKILLASSSSGSRGGGELYLIYLGRALAERGHQVTLWASTHPRMDELCAMFADIGAVARSDYRNTYDYRARSVTAALNFPASSRIAREWSALSPDIVHLNKQNLEDGLDLLRAARLSNLPHISTIHMTQTARYQRAYLPRLRDFVSRRALRRDAGLLVCVLEERARDLARFLGDSSRARTVPNGVMLYDLRGREAIRAEQRAALQVPADHLLLAAVGRLVPQKRPFKFLELAERIHAKIPNTRFIWVGDGHLASRWDAAVHDRRLNGIVRRMGWQSHVRDFLFAADAFVHTAEFEGLPLAILEALSAALPCAITPNLISEMPFLTDENSITIGDDDRWVAVLSDRARLHQLGANARRLAEAEFSFDLMAQRYEALYREAIANRPRE